MPSTQNLQQSLIWCGAFIKFSPLLIGGQEPALSNARLVHQTILGPPFCWRWNRSSAGFNCVVTAPPTQDYVMSIPDFGFLEKAWVKKADGSDSKEMEVRNVLGASVDIGRPEYIAAQADDNAGNITLRLMGAPDAAYATSFLYQRKPPLLTSVAQSWAPIPDEYSYIYNWGFLTLAAVLLGDSRFPIFNQKFMSHLLGAAEGLDELQRNIFLGNWLQITKQIESMQMKTKQGVEARQQ